MLDPALRVVINGQFYWAASEEEAARFRTEPHLVSGSVFDPSTHRRFTPTDRSPRRDLPDQILLFEDLDTLNTFDANPELFSGHAHWPDATPAPGPPHQH